MGAIAPLSMFRFRWSLVFVKNLTMFGVRSYRILI